MLTLMTVRVILTLMKVLVETGWRTEVNRRQDLTYDPDLLRALHTRLASLYNRP